MKRYVLVIGIFYLIIFLAIKNTLIFTPDFGLSDSYHGNLSVKHLLGESFRQGRVPFWVDSLEGGYPLYSEGQIGTFFIPNAVLGLLPFSSAVNFIMLFCLFLISTGFFLLSVEFGVAKIIGLMLGLALSFTGSISLRLIHFSLIESFSLTPLLFWLWIRYQKTDRKVYLVLFSMMLSQMFFAGFTQMVFIILLGLFLFTLTVLWSQKKSGFIIVRRICHLLIAVAMGVGLAAPQIIPSRQFQEVIQRSLQLDYRTVTDYPFTIKNLINFIFPYFYGSPKNGSYPVFSDSWGIFWENTPYLGIFAIILFSVAFFWFRGFRRTVFFKLFWSTIIIIIISLLLAMSKGSPLYFVYNFPPFNYFRTQSRFLLLSSFLWYFIFALAVSYLYKNSARIFRTLIVFLLVINLADLVLFTGKYHLFIDAEKFLAPPPIAHYINKDKAYLTLGAPAVWNKTFLGSGWETKKQTDEYIFNKNFLYPNSNLYYGLKSASIYTGLGFSLRRSGYARNIMGSGITEQSDRIIIAPRTQNLMRLLGIDYLIVPKQIIDNNFQLKKKVSQDDMTVFLYQLVSKPKKDSIMYIPKTIKKISFLSEFANLHEENNDFINRAVVESAHFNRFKNNPLTYQVTNLIKSDTHVVIQGVSDQEGVIVLRKNFYPNWEVFVNSQKETVTPVNISHLGFIVPKGKSRIDLKFNNDGFYFGVGIALVIFIGASLWVLLPTKRR